MINFSNILLVHTQCTNSIRKFKSQQWQEGDVVRLKFGGPVMTLKVYDVYKGGNVCHWFVGTTLQEGVVSNGQLGKADEGDY